MLAAAGSQSQHLFGISSVKHHDVEANCLICLDRSVSLSGNCKYTNSIQFCGFTCRVFRQWKWSNLQLTSFLWMFVFPQPSVVQTVLLAARRNMVLPSWTWNIGMSWPDAHGCGPACGHLLGITMARHLTWLELGTMKHKRLSDHPAENVGLPHARKNLKFSYYVATLPSERWTRWMLELNIKGPRRPAYTWDAGKIFFLNPS